MSSGARCSCPVDAGGQPGPRDYPGRQSIGRRGGRPWRRHVEVLRGEGRSLAADFVRQMPGGERTSRNAGSGRRPAGATSESGPIKGGRPCYSLTDLGSLGGKTDPGLRHQRRRSGGGRGRPRHGTKHAFLYTAGKLKDLGTLRGGDSCAFGINAAGQVVG